MRHTSRRRLLAVLVLMTVAVLVVDVAGGPGGSALRSAGGLALGPLERLLAPGGRGSTAAAEEAPREVVGLDLAAADSRAAQQLGRLMDAPDLSGRAFLPARVVALGREGAAGPERVTLDVGSRDGVRADVSVVDADGLVGRVVEVSAWTCDVLLVGSADLVVGVRVGADGTLGSVGSGADGAHRRAAGKLNLTVVQRGSVRAGDVVTTLGSVGGSPVPAGLRVGTVEAVDEVPGDLTPTASVQPSVDVTTLGLVGVLLQRPRSVARTAVTGGG